MIQCPECGAYLKPRDANCWHCNHGMSEHWTRRDIRYRIAYSKALDIILAMGLVAMFIVVVALAVTAVVATFGGHFSVAGKLAVQSLMLLVFLSVILRVLL